MGLPYNLTDNPVAETAKDAGYNRNVDNVINGRGEVVWEVPWVEGLKVRAASNYRYYGSKNKSWRKMPPNMIGIHKKPLMPTNPNLV